MKILVMFFALVFTLNAYATYIPGARVNRTVTSTGNTNRVPTGGGYARNINSGLTTASNEYAIVSLFIYNNTVTKVFNLGLSSSGTVPGNNGATPVEIADSIYETVITQNQSISVHNIYVGPGKTVYIGGGGDSGSYIYWNFQAVVFRNAL